MLLALWTLGTLIVVGLLIWMIITINKRDGSDSIKPKDPLDIAKERYLRGEITAEELEDIARHQL